MGRRTAEATLGGRRGFDQKQKLLRKISRVGGLRSGFGDGELDIT
jgi:hypothetical protein